MTLVQLQHFIALVRCGSFVKASQAVHLTQPALSRSIQALEEELGQLLFDRIGRRIELTTFGAETLKRAQLLVEEAQDLRQSGRPGKLGEGGRLRLGLSSGPGVLLTVPLLTHVARHFPRFHMEVSRANTDILLRQLRERSVDALIVDLRSLKPGSDLRVERVVELPGTFLCRPGHPLARLPQVSPAQLLAYPVASTPLSDELARILVERYGEHAHPQEMVTLLSDEISHLVELALGSDAVVLAIRAAAPQLVALPLLPALDARARFGLVTLAGRAQPAFLPELGRLMDQVFSGLDQPDPASARSAVERTSR